MYLPGCTYQATHLLHWCCQAHACISDTVTGCLMCLSKLGPGLRLFITMYMYSYVDVTLIPAMYVWCTCTYSLCGTVREQYTHCTFSVHTCIYMHVYTCRWINSKSRSDSWRGGWSSQRRSRSTSGTTTHSSRPRLTSKGHPTVLISTPEFSWATFGCAASNMILTVCKLTAKE